MSIKFYKNNSGVQEFEASLLESGGGMNTRDEKRMLADGESPSERNAVIMRRGSVGKRYGYDVVSEGAESGYPQGMMRYVKTGATVAKYLLLFQNGKVWKVTPSDFTWTSIKTGLDADAVTRGITFKNTAVYGNGVDNQQQWDGTTAADVGSGCPKSTIMAVINTMLLAANGSQVYWSDPELLTFNGTNAGDIAVNYQDGEDVTALIEQNDAVIAFKDTTKRGLSVVFDDTDIAVGLRESEIADKTGAVATGSVIAGDLGGIYYLARHGFRSFGIQENYPQQRTSAGLSRKIRSLVDRINPSARDRVWAAEHDDMFLFAVPMDTATVNDTLLVYVPETNAWTVWDIPVAAFADFEDSNGKEGVYFLHALEPKLCRFNQKYVDDSGGNDVPILFEREWKGIVPARDSQWDELEMEMMITVPNETTVTVVIDQQEWEFVVTEEDISGDVDFFDGGYFGGCCFGTTPFAGDEIDPGEGPKKYRLVLRRSIDTKINKGTEATLRVKNDKIAQGVDILNVYFRGKPLLYSETT